MYDISQAGVSQHFGLYITQFQLKRQHGKKPMKHACSDHTRLQQQYTTSHTQCKQHKQEAAIEGISDDSILHRWSQQQHVHEEQTLPQENCTKISYGKNAHIPMQGVVIIVIFLSVQSIRTARDNMGGMSAAV